MSIITDKKRVEEIVARGVIAEVLPTKDEFLKLLLSGKKLKIYIGFDPTSSTLHLSHAKNFILLEEFRQLGHEVIVLFGDFTAQIGDPTGRSDARPQLTEEEVKKNVKDWIAQIKPLMNFDDKKNPPRVLFNSAWLSKLSLKDLIPLASQFTVQQMIERDMFEKRWNNDIPIHLHEFLYPLMQGYDSVAMDVDVELCGTDQIFNALAGRTLMKRLKNKEKFVVAVNLMANPKTGELMSKSRGTGVFLSSPPNEMFGAVMAQPDEMIEVLFINITRIPLNDIKEILNTGPKEAKMHVAFEIVKKFYGEEKATLAKDEWISVFSKKEGPHNAPELKLKKKNISILDLLLESGIKSKSEARRLVLQNAISIDSEVKKNPEEIISLKGGEILKVGKKTFFKLLK
ncbi:MAG: tyrosine--tRNA ligase [Patescibacteria group bacterium]